MTTFAYLCLCGLALFAMFSRNRPIVIRIAIVVGTILVALLIYIASTAWSPIEDRGPAPSGLGHIKSPWKEAILFLVMIAGMLSKYMWDLIEARRISRRRGGASVLKFDVWEFVQPLFAAGCVFSTVLNVANVLSFSLILLSYQNGFFWQTIFDRTIKRRNGTLR